MESRVLVSERKGHDIREDEEQGVKLQEIVDLLVAAGYFRARIKGLSPFDKVVGGMTWCMESCYYDVDVDILFQENSSIGQKIALTEKIVTVLPRMGCPYRIEPHQIQGLDFIHIFPVIQWLVKQSVAVREEKKEFLRSSAVREYERKFVQNDTKEKALQNLFKLQEEYRPRRILRRKDELPVSEEEQVESVLMEYGLLECIPSSSEAEERSSNSFIQALELDGVSPSKAVRAIVSSQGEAIAAISQEFADVHVDEDLIDVLKRQKEALLEEKKIELMKVNDETLKLTAVRQTLQNLRSNLSDSDGNKSEYLQLQDLILMEDSLKKQEQEFREHCRSELERLQTLVKEASEKNGDDAEESDAMCEAERSRVSTLRLQIARKNRAVAQLQRRLDEIPGRAELAQYQRRFLELYSLVAQKHAETKQFYTMYNTLDDTRLYLAKQLNLLNSVLDTYTEAMSNALDKSMFIEQFESIVTAIKSNKGKVEVRRDAEKRKRDALSQQLLELVEQQRRYVAVVKQLKIEVKRNEVLLGKIRSITE